MCVCVCVQRYVLTSFKAIFNAVQSTIPLQEARDSRPEMLNQLDVRNINNSTTWGAGIVKLYEVPGKASQR